MGFFTVENVCLTENSLESPSQSNSESGKRFLLANFRAGVCEANTSDQNKASTIRTTNYLFKVDDLPDEGFPTRPMSGSRGIVLSGNLSRLEVYAEIQ